jgi:membrane protease YdiL (CAAX protease family)
VLTLLLWVLYRSLFTFPVWFDEIIGKALFFGFPVWLYINIVGAQKILETMSLRKFQSGILLGLAVGGIFGFATSILSLVTRDVAVQQAALFSSQQFWGEFVLALFTGFWETLLFFTFICTVIQEKYSKWAVSNQALLTAVIFLVFHLPNIYLRFAHISTQAMVVQVILLFLFALGQAFLFIGRRNTFALILSHAIWGMVLLVHTW